jgi:hypothetical protein
MLFGICIFASWQQWFISYKLQKENNRLMGIMFDCARTTLTFAIAENKEPKAWFICAPLPQ